MMNAHMNERNEIDARAIISKNMRMPHPLSISSVALWNGSLSFSGYMTMNAAEKHVRNDEIAMALPSKNVLPMKFEIAAASMKNVIYIRTRNRFLAGSPADENRKSARYTKSNMKYTTPPDWNVKPSNVNIRHTAASMGTEDRTQNKSGCLIDGLGSDIRYRDTVWQMTTSVPLIISSKTSIALPALMIAATAEKKNPRSMLQGLIPLFLRLIGFEPITYCLEGSCSIQMS